MSKKSFALNTNNSVYNCIVSDASTDIEFLLPYGIPNQNPYVIKNIEGKDVVLLPAEQFKFKIFLTVLTEEVPKVDITYADSKNHNPDSIFGRDIKLEPKSCQLISIISSDSGNTYSVVNNVYGKVDTDAKLAVLAKAIADEEARAKAAEEELQNAIQDEEDRALAVESHLSDELVKSNARIKALEDAGYQTEDDVIKILKRDNYVADAEYNHTDNNYTNEDKEKVDTINLA